MFSVYIIHTDYICYKIFSRISFPKTTHDLHVPQNFPWNTRKFPSTTKNETRYFSGSSLVGKKLDYLAPKRTNNVHVDVLSPKWGEIEWFSSAWTFLVSKGHAIFFLYNKFSFIKFQHKFIFKNKIFMTLYGYFNAPNYNLSRIYLLSNGSV